MLHPYEVSKQAKLLKVSLICKATGLTHPTVMRIKSGDLSVTLKNYKLVSDFLLSTQQ